MRIVLGSDHAGFELKQKLIAHLQESGHQIIDVGTNSTSPVDYPDSAQALAMVILNRQAERGILICGSGIGSAIAANKIPGIRAGLCHDFYSAHQGVEHNDLNVLVLGSRIIAFEYACDLVKIFLEAKFCGEERFQRRLAKVKKLESSHRE